MYKLYALCFLTAICLLLAVAVGLGNGPTWLAISLVVLGAVGALSTIGMVINDAN